MAMKIEQRIVFVDTAKIKPASFNPPIRTEPGILLSLKKSIEAVGIIYPLLITENYKLIDGHRRLACAIALGMEKVPAIIMTGNTKEVFAYINQTARRLGTKDELYVYLSGGPISKRTRDDILKLETVVDRKDLEYMGEARISAHSIMQQYIYFKNYCADREIEKKAEDWSKFVKWMIYLSQQFAIRTAMANETDPKLIWAAIEANTPIG